MEHEAETALTKGISPEFSTYHLRPSFMRNLEEGDEMINGWNTHLEEWLLDIQRDSNTYYCILVETARWVTWWKWFWIVIYIFVTASGLIITTITLALGVTEIWLPILLAIISACGAGLTVFMDAVGYGVWAGDCRSAAEQFILLGRRIESQKRIPRNQRVESGIKFSNAASMRFEELRGQIPGIPASVMKRYTLVHKESTSSLKIPIQLVDYHEQEASPLGGNNQLEEVVVDDPLRKESPKEKEETSDSVTPSEKQDRRLSLQSIFSQRLEMVKHKQEEQDELGQYEEYVRQQYLASTSPWDTPRVLTPRKTSGGISQLRTTMHTK